MGGRYVGEISNILMGSGYNNSIVIKFESEDAQIERMIEVDKGVVTNEKFYLSDQIQGQGIGSKVLFDQVRILREWNMSSIEFSAARGQYENGYYTWARLGALPKNNLGVKKILDDGGRKEKSLPELMSTEEGRKFWKEFGQEFQGVFDLRDNSDSMNILNEYKKEKGL